MQDHGGEPAYLSGWLHVSSAKVGDLLPHILKGGVKAMGAHGTEMKLRRLKTTDIILSHLEGQLIVRSKTRGSPLSGVPGTEMLGCIMYVEASLCLFSLNWHGPACSSHLHENLCLPETDVSLDGGRSSQCSFSSPGRRDPILSKSSSSAEARSSSNRLQAWHYHCLPACFPLPPPCLPACPTGSKSGDIISRYLPFEIQRIRELYRGAKPF